MKKIWINAIFILALMSNCKDSTSESSKNTPEITKGDVCSVVVSGIEFTKSLNGAKSTATVEDDKLIFKSNAKTDFFNETDGKLLFNTAPVLLTQIDNTLPFTFTAKVTPTFVDTYDAGTMYIYLNPKLWFKFAFEIDERMKTRIVTVRTIETSDDNNHDIVDAASIYMKISSDTKTIGFYYSLDKENWQLVRVFKNEYPVELWVGLSAQSPLGNGNFVTFEECTLTQTSVADFRMGN